MNDLQNRLIDYGLHLMQAMTGVDLGPANDMSWVKAFEAVMGGGTGAPTPNGPCQTVFSQVHAGTQEPPLTYWRPVPLSLAGAAMLPTAQRAEALVDRAALGGAFKAAVAGLDRNEPGAFIRFYHLMQIHASTLPASYGAPGDTLFQQWKSVAALAWLAGDTIQPPAQALLVSGDLPGIQRAIYTVSSKGAAKTLRGRSFFVQLLGDAAVRRLLHALDLCEANLVYDAGGNFLILARAGQEARVREISDDINRRLLEAFDGSLQLALVCEPLESWMLFDSSEFPEKREALGAALADAKARPFEGMAADWDKLWQPYGTGGEEYCRVTGVDLPDRDVTLGPSPEPGEGQVIVSPLVKSLFDLAYCIRHARLMLTLKPERDMLGRDVRYHDGWDDVLAKISGYRYAFHEMPVHVQKPQADAGTLVYAVNQPEAVAAGYHGCRFIANVTPHVTGADIAWWEEKNPDEPAPERGDIRGFAMLAHASAAAGAIERVGVLRMDVDNLGLLFSGTGTRLTMPLLSELSSTLERFFGGRLNDIVQKTAGNDAYVIYAGGDDLFIVGAWHVLPDLAEAIRTGFRAYTGQHPDLTISGGITLEQPKFPIYRAATRGLEAEEAAKAHARYRRYEDGRLLLDRQGERQPASKKDAICFLGTVVGWEEWALLREQKDAIIALLRQGPNDEKPVPRAMIHVIQKLHRDYAGDLAEARKAFRLKRPTAAPDDRQFYGRWRWMQAYALKRMAGRHEKRAAEIESIQRQLLMPQTVRLAGLAARWAEYLIRKEKWTMGKQFHGDRRDRPPAVRPQVDVVKIMQEGASKEMIEQAEAFGQYLVNLKLKTSQIRNIFGTVREIEMSWQPDAKPEVVAKAKRQLIMLKPKMAYQAAREEQNKKGIGVKELASVLSPAISLVGDDRTRFQNFVDFFEAILAYHTAAGGSN